MPAPTPRRGILPWLATLLALSSGAGCGDSGTAAAPEPAGRAPAEPAGTQPTFTPAPPPGGAPEYEGELLAEIALTDAVRDFGDVWAGAELVHEFRFRAAGEHDLVVVNWRPSCGCTVAHLEIVEPDGTRTRYEKDAAVPPGTELALGVVLDTTNLDGRQRKTVDVYANVEGGVREMALVANVRPLISVEPRTLILDEMSVLESRSGEVTVRGLAREPFQVHPPRIQLPDAMSVAVAPLQPDESGRSRQWRVSVELGPGMPKGAHAYPIALETDLAVDPAPSQPLAATFTVSVRVHGLVSADPQSLNFGMLTPDQTVSRTILLRSRDPGFELPEPGVEIRPHTPGASAAFAETMHVTKRRAEDGAWEIELLLDGLSPEVPRSFLGRAVLSTGHPGEPELEVVFSGLKQGT